VPRQREAEQPVKTLGLTPPTLSQWQGHVDDGDGPPQRGGRGSPLLKPPGREQREGASTNHTQSSISALGRERGGVEGMCGRLPRPRERWCSEAHNASLMPSIAQCKDMPLIRALFYSVLICTEQAD
jgi:hypothetical protein